MSRVRRTPLPGAPGSSHHHQQPPGPTTSRQHLHAYPSQDVSVSLPPLVKNNLGSHSGTNHFGYQFTFSSGIPSPPHSESARLEFFPKGNSQDNSIMGPAGGDRRSPSYPKGSWSNSPASHDILPVPVCSQAASAMYATTSAYPVRQPEQRHDYHQSTNYGGHSYGNAAMPAPSQLLGQQVHGPSNYMLASRPEPSTYGQLSRPANLPPFTAHVSAQVPLPYSSGPTTSHIPPTSPHQWQQPSKYSQICRPPPPHHSRTQAAAPSRPPRPSTVHGNLPREVWDLIFRHLPYQDRLRLRSVNTFFNTTLQAVEAHYKANPTRQDTEDKICLLAAAENYRKHWAPGVAAENHTNRGRPRNDKRREVLAAKAAAVAAVVNAADSDSESSAGTKKRKAPPASIGFLGCYHCYRVLPGEEFCLKTADDDPKDAGTRRAPRRYCLRCGIEKGYHKPMRHYERKVGAGIWVCLCLTINGKGVMDCKSCGKMCPLTPVNRQSRGARGDRF